MPAATILTATHNSAKYIKDCIKSVLNQTWEDWEMIIVDDKSKDRTPPIVESFMSKDKRIRFYKSDTRIKCGGAYNKALQLATGEICCVIDSDDALSHKKSLRKLIKRYETNTDVDYIWTQFYLCDDKLRKLRKGFSSHPGKRSLLEAGIDKKHCFSHWRTFRTYLRDKTLIFNPKLPAAVDKWMGYALEEVGIGGFLPKALYLYRQRLGGLTFTGRTNWKNMKEEFARNRKDNHIEPFPIRILE